MFDHQRKSASLAGTRLEVTFRLAIIAFMTLFLFSCSPGVQQEAEGSDPSFLTLERLFSSNEFAAESFGAVKWADGGAAYLKLEPASDGSKGREIARYGSENGTREVVVSASRLIPEGSQEPIPVSNYEFSPDGKRLLLMGNMRRDFHKSMADCWVLDPATGKIVKLGGKAEPSSLINATWSPDGQKVAYVMKNNLYAEDVVRGSIVPLTRDGSETTINGTFDYVYEEEFFTTHGFRWSPDSRSIAYIQDDCSKVQVFNMINTTDSLYPKLIPIRFSKPGETISSLRIGVVSASGGQTRWFSVPGDPAGNYIQQPFWAKDSAEVFFQHLSREQNRNELMAGDPRTGRIRTVRVDNDPAWLEVVSELHWIGDGTRLTWTCEADGWRRIYLASRSGEEAKPVSGDHDSLGLQAVDEAGGWIYYMASPINPTQRYLYRAPIDGSGKFERVTPLDKPGTHSYQISPDAKWAIHNYSQFDTPPVTELVRLPDHTVVRVLADNAKLREKLGTLKRGASEFFRVDIGDGVLLDVYSMKPFDFNPNKKYPVLFNVYGEPAGSTVNDSFGGNRYLWHLMLTQKGYVVMSVDNRGARLPRGRAWRKSIYKQVGILASADQAAAVREIEKQNPWVDPERIGIYGGSGGGAMTLNVMFRYPEVYSTGIASSSPTSQRLYNSAYQERYMNLPANNPEGYEKGSPVSFAHQLKGNLLIMQGTGDDNVHYQNQEVLINALVKANKPFTMMSYPNRGHGISEGENTVIHKYTLMTRFLLDKMPPGGK